jgi:hypothetical protein
MAQKVVIDGAVIYGKAETRNEETFELFPGLFGVWFDWFHGIEFFLREHGAELQ